MAEMERWAAELGDRFNPGDAIRRVAATGGFYQAFPG
jgi:hypothetical protein